MLIFINRLPAGIGFRCARFYRNAHSASIASPTCSMIRCDNSPILD